MKNYKIETFRRSLKVAVCLAFMYYALVLFSKVIVATMQSDQRRSLFFIAKNALVAVRSCRVIAWQKLRSRAIFRRDSRRCNFFIDNTAISVYSSFRQRKNRQRLQSLAVKVKPKYQIKNIKNIKSNNVLYIIRKAVGAAERNLPRLYYIYPRR